MKTGNATLLLRGKSGKLKKSNAKNVTLLFALLILCSGICYGQNTPAEQLTPVRGHYKQLAALSPKPRAAYAEMDSKKFPFDSAWAKKVLSIKPYYLTGVSVDDFKLPDPPANSSEQTRAELNYLLALQHNRTPEDIRLSLYMSNSPDSASDIGRSLGLWASPQAMPVTAAFFDKLSLDGDYFLWALKFKYARVRPYILEPRLHDLEESLASSYPSGHVTYAYIKAYIYQELMPEFAELFIKSAYDMCHARQIIGVHYPSDCEGSRIFARQLVNMLFKNEKFRGDFENVKKEWALKAAENFNYNK